MHQSTTPSLSQTIWARWASRQFVTLPIVQTLLPVTFGYSLTSRKNLEAVVMRQLRRWERLWWRSLTRSYKRTSMGPSRSCCNGTTSALQPEEITSKGTRVPCVYYQKCPYEKGLETYLMSLVYMSVCVCVCVYIYIYIYVYVCVCVHAYIYIYIYVCVCLCTCVCVCIYIYIYSVCVYIYIYIYIYIYTHTHSVCAYIYDVYVFVWIFVCVCFEENHKLETCIYITHM